MKKKTGLPLYAVMTTISWDYNKKNKHGDPTIRFDLDGEIDDEKLFAKSLQLHADCKDQLLAPIRVTERDNDDTPVRGKKKAAKKKRIVKKKTAAKKRRY